MATQTVQRINLQTAKGQSYAQSGEGGFDDLFNDNCSFYDFLREDQQSSICYGKSQFFNIAGYTLVLDLDLLYGVSDLSTNHDYIECIFPLDQDSILGIVLDKKTKRNPANKELKNIILLNADAGGEGDSSSPFEIVSEVAQYKMPIVSFQCLEQFYPDSIFAIKEIANGRLVLLDYTPDEAFDLTKDEKKLVQKNPKLPAPKLGFTRVGDRWHRSGTCLFHDKKKDRYLLLGQDEGTYFGCELPKKCKTIDEAFKALTPKEVIGKYYQRQGEWFIVPVLEKAVPSIQQCVFLFDDDGILPKDDKESNNHYVHTSDGRVNSKGQVYAYGGEMAHEEHASVYWEKWVTFYKNTALRSVSQQGVD